MKCLVSIRSTFRVKIDISLFFSEIELYILNLFLPHKQLVFLSQCELNFQTIKTENGSHQSAINSNEFTQIAIRILSTLLSTQYRLIFIAAILASHFSQKNSLDYQYCHGITVLAVVHFSITGLFSFQIIVSCIVDI